MSFTTYTNNGNQPFNFDPKPNWGQITDDDIIEAQRETEELIEATRRSIKQTEDNQ
jgi:hypothetical protein